MPHIDHRENSRDIWGRVVEGANNPSIQDIKLGCLLRIADGVEAMSKNYIALANDRDNYKKWYEQQCKELAAGQRSISALRGRITKLKRGVPR